MCYRESQLPQERCQRNSEKKVCSYYNIVHDYVCVYVAMERDQVVLNVPRQVKLRLKSYFGH